MFGMELKTKLKKQILASVIIKKITWKLNSDEDLPLKFHAVTIIIRSVFEENGKLYPQVFLDDAFYELRV